MPGIRPFSCALDPAERWLLILVLLCHGYFHCSGQWNQNARLDSIYAFVEPGPHRLSFRIDSFLPAPDEGVNTGDWARHGGHYYSNKAPGTAFLGIPAYFFLHAAGGALGLDPWHPLVEIAWAYLLNLAVSVAPGAAGAVGFLRACRIAGASPRAAAAAAAAYALATPLFPYSTQMWGHPTAAAFGVFAFLGLLAGTPSGAAASGLCAGLATLCDYSCGALAVLLGAAHLAAGWRRALPYVAGGVPPLMAFMAYHAACFGHPLTLASSHSNPIFIEECKVFGVLGSLDVSLLPELLWGLRRGLLASAPALAFGMAGLLLRLRRQPGFAAGWAALAFCAVLLALNCSFNGWHGGWTPLARYQIAALPFWCFGSAWLLDAWRPWGWRVFLPLAAVSGVNMLAVAALSPLCHGEMPNPVYGWYLPRLFSGELHAFACPIRLQALHPQFSEFARWTSWNWGELLGLSGVASLAPLALAAAFCGWRLARAAAADAQ